MTSKRIASIYITLSIVFLPFLFPSQIHAQTVDWADSCLGTGEASDVASLRGIVCLFQNLLFIILGLIGLITFIMIIAGGFRLLTSAGDPKATEAAKHTISYAVGGLVLAVLAWFIIQIIASFTGIDSITQFDIP